MQSFGRRVYGRQARLAVRCGQLELQLGVDHFHATADRAQLADAAQTPAPAQRIALAGIEVKKSQRDTARAVGDAAQQ